MAIPQLSVPDIVGALIILDPANRTSSLVFDLPQHRTSNTFPIGWTATNLSVFDEAKINDLDETAVAFAWAAGAGTSCLTLDTVLELDLVEVHYVIDLTTAVTLPVFEWSADGVSGWTAYDVLQYTEQDLSPTRRYRIEQFDSPGAKRYRRARRASGSDATAFTEMWFQSYRGAYAQAARYLIFDRPLGERVYARDIPATLRPTIEQPFSLKDVQEYRDATFAADGLHQATIDVVVEDIDGNRSYGRTVRSSLAVVPQEEPLPVQVTAGLNSLVDLTTYTFDRRHPIPCESYGACSIGGFETLAEEFSLYFQISGHVITVKHNHASSPFGKRTLTLSGGDIVLDSPALLHFVWEITQGGYLFVLGRDASGLK